MVTLLVLLEAMSSNCLICAHNNIFNKSILGEDAMYFANSSDIKQLLLANTKKIDYKELILNNFEKVKSTYSWDKIILEYERILLQAL
jgi:glycosyltransferase involved in cell wall biosynthesis